MRLLLALFSCEMRTKQKLRSPKSLYKCSNCNLKTHMQKRRQRVHSTSCARLLADDVVCDKAAACGRNMKRVSSLQLSVKQLNEALRSMHKANKYRQLVFYLEACESGSMFKTVLPTNINVYALTAANERESSWGERRSAARRRCV